ncbi:hypothetical protein DL96DRAFT_1688171, partial [Flagelloscypha sp. PMI_526]
LIPPPFIFSQLFIVSKCLLDHLLSIIARSVPNVGVVPSLLKREEALIEREKTLADVNGKDAGAGSDALDPALLEAINRWTSKPSGLWSPNRFYDNWKGKREIESDATIVERDVKPPIWKPAGAFRLSSWLKNWRREVETDSVEIEERSPSYIFKPAGNWKLGSWLSSWKYDISYTRN